MNESYLDNIQNKFMIERLLQKENISAIEYILSRNSIQFERLKKLNEDGKLDFGRIIKKNELKGLSLKVFNEVDDFLGIKPEKIPKVQYFSLFRKNPFRNILLSSYISSSLIMAYSLPNLVLNKNLASLFALGTGGFLFLMSNSLHSSLKKSRYDLESKKVNLKKMQRNKLIPVAGHEYAHHIQNEIFRGRSTIFEEGHARGVEKHLAKTYKEREDNEAFIYNTLDKSIGEIKSVYMWMCEKLGQEPKKSLLKTKSERDFCEKFYRVSKKSPTPHAIGNSLFSIYEENHGEKIYNQMIHEKFKFD